MSRKCLVYKGSNVDTPLTTVFRYIDTTPAEKRKLSSFTQKLSEAGIAFEHLDKLYIIKNASQTDNISRIKDINNTYGEFITVTPKRLKEGMLYELMVSEEALQRAPLSPHFLDEVYGKPLLDEQLPATETDAKVLAGEMLNPIAETEILQDKQIKAPGIETSLINTFSKAGIGATIVRDENLVDKDGNPQRGRIESIGPKSVRISLNPNLILESEGLYHEFGHLYVDMLGVGNPIVQKGLEQAMRDTALVSQVKKAYPEKAGEDLAKEVFMHKIGKEGAKIVQKNPSKFQVFLNKFFRAVGKMLGISPNAAAVLAEDMFVDKLRDTADISLKGYIEESKVILDVEKLAEETKKNLLNTISHLRLKTKASSMTENILQEVETAQKTLEGITKVQEFILYVSKSTDILNEATRHIDLLETNWRNDFKLKDQYDFAHIVARVVSLMGMFKDPFGGQDMISSIQAAVAVAPQADKDSDGMKELTTHLENIQTIRKKLELKVRTIVLPINAAILVAEKNPDLMESVQDEVDTLRKNFKTHGDSKFVYIDKSSPEYLDAVNFIKEKDLDIGEANRILMDVKIDQLLSKASPDYNTTVAELKKDYVDKSSMSLFFTSAVTDSDVNFQRFTLILARSMSNKQERTRDLAYRLAPKLKELRDKSGVLGKLEISTIQLYEKFIEERTRMVNGKKEKVLYLASPFDVERYNTDISTFKTALKKKLNLVTDAQWDNAAKMIQKSYYAQVTEYIDNISEPIKGAKAKLEGLKTEITIAEKKLKKLQSAYDAETEKIEAGVGNPTTLDDISLSVINAQNAITELKRRASSMYSTYHGRYSGELLQPKAELYSNPRYETVKNDPFYQFFIEEYKKLQDNLPKDALPRETYESMSYMVPSGRITLMNKLETENILSTTWEAGIEGLANLKSQETEYGGHYLRDSGMKVIPIHLNAALPSKLVSRDLGSLLMLFGDMSHGFDEKNKILGFVELYSYFYTNSEQGQGPQALNRQGLLNRGGKTLRKDITDALGVKGPSNKVKMINSYIDSMFYNKKFSQGGVVANKVLNAIMKFTAYDLLGLNMLQTGNQLILDTSQEAGETYSNQFYNRADKLRGQLHIAKLMTKANFWGDFNSLAPKSKLAQLLKYFDISFDAFDMGSGYTAGNKVAKSISMGLVLSPQSFVNLNIKLNRLAALLASYKGKLKNKDGEILLNENGKPADLIDLFQDRGDGVYELSSEIDTDLVDKQRVKNVFRGVTRKANQIEAAVDKPNITRTLWRPVFLMRGWIPGGMQSRWGYNLSPWTALVAAVKGKTSQHLSEELGRVEIPRYAAFIKYFGLLMRNMQDVNAWKDFAKVVKPVSNNAPSIYSEAEAVAIRRQLQAVTTLAATAIAPTLLSKDDDDEDNSVYWYSLYQIKRLRAELLFYANPIEFYNIAVRSPTATARPFENIWKLLYQAVLTVQYEAGDMTGIPLHFHTAEEMQKKLFYQRKAGEFIKGDRKIWKPAKALVPALNGLSKNPKEAIKWFDSM